VREANLFYLVGLWDHNEESFIFSYLTSLLLIGLRGITLLNILTFGFSPQTCTA
jgi:hypothetical protein